MYVEDNFPLAVKGNVRAAPRAALDYLLGNAEVGSKVAGFFHTVPSFTPLKPLRSACLLFSTELPVEIKIPVFFCKTPEQLSSLIPKALKVSVDTQLPVQVVLAPNSLNNYTNDKILEEAQDRVQPYINRQVVDALWDPAQKKEKLEVSFTAQREQEAANADISFFVPEAYFPEYIFPSALKNQRDTFKGVKKFHTTKKELQFLHLWLKEMLELKVEIDSSLELRENPAKTLLCPGCPFTAVFACKDASSTIVFTSIKCPAIFEHFALSAATVMEYAGMVSQKPSVATAFIGNMSDILPYENLLGGTVIALQDSEKKAVYPVVAVNKFKKFMNCTLPYSCANIKKGKKVAVKAKKCNCVKLGTEAVCMQASRCPALRLTEDDVVSVNAALCSGCRVCANVCPPKAIS